MAWYVGVRGEERGEEEGAWGEMEKRGGVTG